LLGALFRLTWTQLRGVAQPGLERSPRRQVASLSRSISSRSVAMAAQYFVYVLRSDATGRFYTGSTSDLIDRLSRHNAGRSVATRHGVPWTLVYHESYSTRSDAIFRERFFKSGKGRDELRSLLAAQSAPNDPNLPTPTI
jgi:putative endonuclease